MTSRLANLVLAFATGVAAITAGAATLDEGVKALRAQDIDGAIRQLKPLADLGDPDAAWYLGSIYDNDSDRAHRDDNRAYMLLARAARAGNPLASDALFKMRTRGKVSFLFEMYGLQQKQIDELAPLRKAAESNDADSIAVDDLTRVAVATCESMGRRSAKGAADTSEDNQPALAWLQRAAQKGQPQAQFLVALAFLGRQPCYVAHPLEPDVGQAQNWLRKAAAQGVVSAQVTLARLELQAPAGLSPDPAGSAEGLRSAISRGDVPAMGVLADFLARGLGMPADAAEASRLRLRAAELGDPESAWKLGESLTGRSASPDELRRAFALFSRCADAGAPRCQYDLAMMYIQGRGTAADEGQFMKFLKLAANNDDATAQAHLGQTLLFATGAAQDVKAGISYLRSAASRGHPVAMFRLADEYRTGDHLARDLPKSWALYTLAAQRGDVDAKDVLRQMRPQLAATQIERGDDLAKEWSPDRRQPGGWNWRALSVQPRDPATAF